MSTRRDLATALFAFPLIAAATKSEASPVLEPYGEDAVRIISYTLYAEARGEPFKGKLAVAAVIQTRARLANASLTEVCLKEKQFSCWNELDSVPEYYVTGRGMQPADISARSDCYSIAWVVISSSRKWKYLTHFYNPAKATPSWAASLRGKKTIGKHVFGYLD
ncbi:MAG: cell wall hydrolase [Kiritimatiellaceae bacterium]|nr:cell wall hydrolase [Kiritimatiellaceae bacterium]